MPSGSIRVVTQKCNSWSSTGSDVNCRIHRAARGRRCALPHRMLSASLTEASICWRGSLSLTAAGWSVARSAGDSGAHIASSSAPAFLKTVVLSHLHHCENILPCLPVPLPRLLSTCLSNATFHQTDRRLQRVLTWNCQSWASLGLHSTAVWYSLPSATLQLTSLCWPFQGIFVLFCSVLYGNLLYSVS